jgi:hypothetical protein
VQIMAAECESMRGTTSFSLCGQALIAMAHGAGGRCGGDSHRKEPRRSALPGKRGGFGGARLAGVPETMTHEP